MINTTKKIPIIGIYKITSPTNKIYIGQSSNIKIRWFNYFNLGCKGQPQIYRSLKKYGVKNHKFEIIEECSLEQLNEKETYWKLFYINEIGWKQVLFSELYDGGGGPKSDLFKQKVSESNSKPIIQYDLEGNFIKEWSSVTEASIFYSGKYTDSIGMCCRGKYEYSFGFVWCFKGRKFRKPKFPQNKKVLQMDLKFNIINEFISIDKASKHVGIDSGTLCACLKGRTKTCKGYKWKYK